MYAAVKKIKRLRPPQKLLIKGKNGLTTNPAEKSKIIAEYFKDTLYKNKQPSTIIPPTRMKYRSQLMSPKSNSQNEAKRKCWL